MDFHVRPIFVNLILLVLLALSGPAVRAEERAILLDGETLVGRLALDPAAGLVFRGPDGERAVPARQIRKILANNLSAAPRGTTPAHRITFWGNESLSGTVRAIGNDSIQLETPAGDSLRVPLYLVHKIEHFQGEAVILRDDFERADAPRRLAGDASRNATQAASGQCSLRLTKPGDSAEYSLAESCGSGSAELRFFDSGRVQAGSEWLCELEFSSASGVRLLQLLLGWAVESYGLATPKGPSLPVQRLARRAGWHRLAVHFGAERTSVLVDDAVLTHADVGLGNLRAIRLLVRLAEETEAPQREDEQPVGYVDDLQVAESVATGTDRQPSPDQDDVVFTGGDQLYGRIESATDRAVTIGGEFGRTSVSWRQLHGLYFTNRACPTRSLAGQRVRVQFGSAAAPRATGFDWDALEGVLCDLTDDTIVLEHPRVGRLRIIRGSLREMEFLSAGRWLALDCAFHHFGNRLKERFQVPHPEGNGRSWKFLLDRVPERAALILHVLEMEPARSPGLSRKAEQDELRTYVSINGQPLDPMGLNHLLPPSARGPVRLSVPIPSGVLREGDNVLRLHQSAQKEDPNTFDDCGVFGIGIDLKDNP